MALSFDFSVIFRRLDRTIQNLQNRDGDQLFSSDPLVHDASYSLRECLQEMASRSLRTCLVYYPKGVPEGRRNSSARRYSQGSRPSSGVDLDPEVKKTGPPVPSSPKIVVESVSGGDDAARVRDETLDRWAHETYQFLDMRDVLFLLLERYDEIYGPNGEKSDRPAREFLDELLDIQIGGVANLSGRNGFTSAYDCCTMRELLRRFENSPRIPVFNYTENGDDRNQAPDLIGIFSVIDFLQLLNKLTVEESDFDSSLVPSGDPMTTFAKKPTLTAIDTFTASMIKTVTQPARAKKYSELHICFEDESLFSALKVLLKTGFSAIPIVSHSNPRNCVGIFSVRDLLPILLQTSDLFVSGALLSIPIMDYVSSIRQMQSLKARYPVIHVRQNATIDAVVGKILAANVRRLLLTDDEGMLTGILSVTDLGRFISRELAR